MGKRIIGPDNRPVKPLTMSERMTRLHQKIVELEREVDEARRAVTVPDTIPRRS